MTAPSIECPGCGQAARFRTRRGSAARYECLTTDCPVESILLHNPSEFEPQPLPERKTILEHRDRT